ncbi:hypothetical protein E2493_12305 [Sphingomonas parva]|uniref:Uncharacterized protein n=1 Tax=Sphingomonas parva TaxID=2555898 RepID=A0A4Y8ZPP0_9SPHN|nr:hypothetical protein [Sphingomonas parva]TFI57971.1 hypothetical protein E2493_12305 [Sphingomonas parva]
MSGLTLGHLQIGFGIVVALIGIVSGLAGLRAIRAGTGRDRPQQLTITVGASVFVGIGLCLLGLFSDAAQIRLT